MKNAASSPVVDYLLPSRTQEARSASLITHQDTGRLGPSTSVRNPIDLSQVLSVVLGTTTNRRLTTPSPLWPQKPRSYTGIQIAVIAEPLLTNRQCMSYIKGTTLLRMDNFYSSFFLSVPNVHFPSPPANLGPVSLVLSR